jgi:hypothetical protein
VTDSEVVADPYAEGFVVAPIARASIASTGAWLLLGAGLIVTGVAIASEFFPVRVVLDLAALWPLLGLGLLAAGFSFMTKRDSTSRIVGPLLLVTWLMLGLGWFVSGGSQGPSRAANVEVEAADVMSGALTLSVPGDLIFGGPSDVTFAVEPQRVGGKIGPPQVSTKTTDGALAGAVIERNDAPWFLSKGWVLRLNPGHAWDLELEAESLRLDLSGLNFGQLVLIGDGSLTLGKPLSGQNQIVVRGDISISVPESVAVEVVGNAQVPEGWIQDGDTHVKLGVSPLWHVVVEEGTATFLDR